MRQHGLARRDRLSLPNVDGGRVLFVKCSGDGGWLAGETFPPGAAPAHLGSGTVQERDGLCLGVDVESKCPQERFD